MDVTIPCVIEEYDPWSMVKARPSFIEQAGPYLAAAGTLVVILGSILGALIWINDRFSGINQRLDRAEAAIKTLSSQQTDKTNALVLELLAQASLTDRTGKPELAVRSMQTAEVFLNLQRENQIATSPKFFQDAAQRILLVKSTSENSAVLANATTALIKLAEYRSVLNEKPLPSAFEIVKNGPEFIKLPPPYDIDHKFSCERCLLKNGTQILDGAHWLSTTFENAHIIYMGGFVDLQNVKFVNCTFEVRSQGPSTDKVLLYAVLNGEKHIQG